VLQVISDFFTPRFLTRAEQDPHPSGEGYACISDCF